MRILFDQGTPAPLRRAFADLAAVNKLRPGDVVELDFK
jgi:hypothetical protein